MCAASTAMPAGTLAGAPASTVDRPAGPYDSRTPRPDDVSRRAARQPATSPRHAGTWAHRARAAAPRDTSPADTASRLPRIADDTICGPERPCRGGRQTEASESRGRRPRKRGRVRSRHASMHRRCGPRSTAEHLRDERVGLVFRHRARVMVVGQRGQPRIDERQPAALDHGRRQATRRHAKHVRPTGMFRHADNTRRTPHIVPDLLCVRRAITRSATRRPPTCVRAWNRSERAGGAS